MTIQFKSNGEPFFDVAGYRLSFINNSKKEKEERWNWIAVVAPKSKIEIGIKKKGKKTRQTISSDTIERDIVPVKFTGLRKKVMPTALKNKIAKILKTFVKKDGYIYREDIKKVYKGLVGLSESVYEDDGLVERINIMITE